MAGQDQLRHVQGHRGAITDPYFANNWNARWELSHTMPRFGYHYFHASDDPVKQAERFVATIKQHGLRHRG